MFQSLVKKTSTVLFTSADEMRFVKDTEDCLGKGTALLPIRSCNLQAEVADIYQLGADAAALDLVWKLIRKTDGQLKKSKRNWATIIFYVINFLEAIFLKADWSIDFLGMTNSDNGSLQWNVTTLLLKNVTTPLIA